MEKRDLAATVALLAAACLGAPGSAQAQEHGKVVIAPGSPTVYLITAAGTSYPFLNPETFLGCGFKWADVETVTQDWLDYAFRVRMFPLSDVPSCEVARGIRPAPKAPPERAPVMVEGSPDVYYVLPDGTKHHIANPGAFLRCGLGWTSVQKVSRQQLDAMTNGPELPDSTACRTARRLAFVVTWTDAPQGVAEMLGKVVSIPGQGTVYFVTDWGIRYQFSNPEAFTGCGFRWTQVQTVSALPLFSLIAGPALASGADCRMLRN